MNMTDIVSIISSVGFPIVMCIAMCWYIKYQADKHQEESAALRDVISENTKILEGLRQLIADRLNES